MLTFLTKIVYSLQDNIVLSEDNNKNDETSASFIIQYNFSGYDFVTPTIGSFNKQKVNIKDRKLIVEETRKMLFENLKGDQIIIIKESKEMFLRKIYILVVGITFGLALSSIYWFFFV